jgi:tRNA(Ile)-lysidine synthase
MLTAFIEHISLKNLLDSSRRYLLACSGGKDSMALAHLLLEAKIPFEVAHVNFQLRGEESNEDQNFVRKWSDSHRIPFHTLNADTTLLASQKGISIQMAAREIRYDFFEQIRLQNHLYAVLLAHHEDDQIETVLLNLTRGTGIDGLAGMAERNGNLIRPLLPFSKSQIEKYLQENQIAWREDQSNAEIHYKRNFLRHEVIPALLQSEPTARQNILNSIDRFRETSKALSSLMKDWIEKNIRVENGYHILDLRAIRHQRGISTLIFQWLRPYGFNPTQTVEIAQKLSDYRIGSAFYSIDYELIFDRECLVLGKKPSTFSPISLSAEAKSLSTPNGTYQVEHLTWPTPLDTSRENAMLDIDTLDFPLTIRTWKEGDRFVPLGMNSEKKISDFLIDLKVSLIEKETVLVLESAGKIAWVIGYRIADWAKCSASTRICLHFKKS